MPRLGSLSSRSLSGIGIKAAAAGLTIKDIVTGSAASYTDLTTSSTIKNYNTGSIVLSGQSATPGVINVAGLGASTIITVEMWRRYGAAAGFFDFQFELNANANNYLFLQTDGTVRGKLNGASFATGSSGWTQAVNQWDHYVLTLNQSSLNVVTAKNGTRNGSVFGLSGVGTYSGPITTIRFKDSTYSGVAQGYVDDVRVSLGDVYNLLNTASYTTPTGPLTVVGGTTNFLIRAA